MSFDNYFTFKTKFRVIIFSIRNKLQKNCEILYTYNILSRPRNLHDSIPLCRTYTIISRNLKIFRNKNIIFVTSLCSLFGGYIFWNGLDEAYISLL